MIRLFAVVWAVLGVTLLLGFAIFRLFHHAAALSSVPMSGFHYFALLVTVIFMAYFEGYRGFQCGFSPRVAARIRFLKNNATKRTAILAPFFSLGYFGSTRSRQIAVIVLTLGLVCLVMAMNFVPQPWRGIVDSGVVVGLTWGLLSFYWFTIQALLCQHFTISPEIPDSYL